MESPIPKDRPVILAANHPNAFTEPLLMACFSGRVLHFITRSDVFHPLLMWFFKGTHQIPIYRFVDNRGYKNLKNNQDTFAKCYDVLAKNGAILIFSEGSTKLGKTVRPLQKGTAKMAFGLMDAYPEVDPVIIPVGFTYSRPNHWNGDVMVNIGTAIDVKNYRNTEVHLNESIKKLNATIKNQLDTLAINIEDSANEEFQEGVAHIHRRQIDHSINPLIRSNTVFKKEVSWTRQVNDNQVSEKTKTTWNAYRGLLKKHGIKSEDFVIGDFTITKFLFLILFAPIALFGLLICFIPLKLTSLFVKNKVKHLIFSSGIKIGMGTFVSLLVAILISLCCIVKCGWMALLLFPLLVLSMYIGIKWLAMLKSAWMHLKYSFLNKNVKEELSHEF